MDGLWWQRGIIYQIYPRSFQDTDRDGIGDLPGIIRRLDYLQWLGVDAIWISPIYPSPMADFGYDVSDYCDVHPLFGNLADMDRLIAEAHSRGLRVVLDFVPNHTSDQHPWFLDSRSSRHNAKRNWYIWRDAKSDGSPPNNWISNFGGSAWQWDELTGQYYYHAFLKEQPDLNWRNLEVRTAMYDVLRFWLDRGVDGFRVDVLWHLIKDAAFRDNPVNPAHQPHHSEIEQLLQVFSADQPEVQEVVREMRSVLNRYPERVLIGEIYLPLERLVAYYGEDLAGAHLPFNFQLLQAPWQAGVIAGLINEYQAKLPAGGWPNWVLGNHDKPRIAARVGEPQARVAAMLLLTLRGTPTLFYGDEIGLGKIHISPEQVQDPWERNEPGLGFGRDPQRTPMQWDASQFAGFSESPPWLPLSADHEQRNIERQKNDPGSMLSLYRRLIDLRRNEPAFVEGECIEVKANGSVLSYLRQHEGRRFLIILNFESGPDASVAWPADGVVLLSTHLDRPRETWTHMLRSGEGVIIELSS